jgi:hypothetical protein
MDEADVVLALVVLCVVSVGRAFAQGVVLPLPAEDSQRINSMLGPGEVGNPVSSKPIADGSLFSATNQDFDLSSYIREERR